MTDGARPADDPADPLAWWTGPRVAWAVVAVGSLLRLGRYALDPPLWWNEAFVVVNLLRRDYRDLLCPLDYGQVAPLGFLGAEKAITDALGLSAWTLRLFPLICGLLGLLVYRRVVALAAPGLPGLLALAILAVAYHPIRLASEVKPYAGDLLAALTLLWLALEWRREPARTGWLGALALLTPLLLVGSHPAVFAAGGLWLALAPSVERSRSRAARIAWGLWGLSTAGSFLALYLVQTGAQSAATLPAMRAYWHDAFPPLARPWLLPGWLLATHTGRMFAYPGGGDAGASAATAWLGLIGVVVLVRTRQLDLLALLLAPFGLTLLAAALQRHPYGGHPRVTQHLAPAIGLLMGLGLAALLVRIRPGGDLPRRVRWTLLALLACGVLPLIGELRQPYRTRVEHDARQFARSFWPRISQDAEVACLRWDLPVAPWESPDLDTALYLSNQAIYRPRRPPGPCWQRVAAAHPLRCVLYRSDREPAPDLAAWQAQMAQQGWALVGQTREPVGNRAEVVVFSFVPAPTAPDAVAGRGLAVD